MVTRRARIKTIIKKKKANSDTEGMNFLDARSNGLKLLANSFYGYLGFLAHDGTLLILQAP